MTARTHSNSAARSSDPGEGAPRTRLAGRAPLRAISAGALLLGLLVGPSGCGHEATEADCEFIAGRIVELELRAQNITDPNEIERRRAEMIGSGAAKRATLDGCLGRHITERSLACVRAANTPEEVTDKCLR